jgi:ankyrin repeat protein
LSLDMWTQCQIQLLQFIGNDKANMIWESSLLDSSSSSLKYREIKPMAHSSHEVKENFILSKYIKKLYVGSFPSPLNSKTIISAGSKPPTLFMCVKARNIYDVMRCLVHDEGDVVNAKSKADNDSTALHIAVDSNFIELVELLCLWQADLNALDGDNQKPIDIAKRHNNYQVISTLLLYST